MVDGWCHRGTYESYGIPRVNDGSPWVPMRMVASCQSWLTMVRNDSRVLMGKSRERPPTGNIWVDSTGWQWSNCADHVDVGDRTKNTYDQGGQQFIWLWLKLEGFPKSVRPWLTLWYERSAKLATSWLQHPTDQNFAGHGFYNAVIIIECPWQPTRMGRDLLKSPRTNGRRSPKRPGALLGLRAAHWRSLIPVTRFAGDICFRFFWCLLLWSNC